MGFIIVAKARQGLLMFSETMWAIAAVALAWGCISWRGLKGAGMAFFLAYVGHWIIVYPIVRKLSGFHWSTYNRKAGLILLGLIGVLFASVSLTRLLWATIIGIAALIVSGSYSLRVMLHLLPFERIPLPIRRSLIVLRLAPNIS